MGSSKKKRRRKKSESKKKKRRKKCSRDSSSDDISNKRNRYFSDDYQESYEEGDSDRFSKRLRKLMLAIRLGAVRKVKRQLNKLLASGKCISDLRAGAGIGVLHKAASSGHMGVLRLLLNEYESESGPLMDSLGSKGSPLHCAVAGGYLEACCFLIEKGADVDIQDIKGNTPLHLALLSRSPLVVLIFHLFHSYSADPNIKNKRGETANSLGLNEALEDYWQLEDESQKEWSDELQRNEDEKEGVSQFWEKVQPKSDPYDHCVRSEREFKEKLEFMAGLNPSVSMDNMHDDWAAEELADTGAQGRAFEEGITDDAWAETIRRAFAQKHMPPSRPEKRNAPPRVNANFEWRNSDTFRELKVRRERECAQKVDPAYLQGQRELDMKTFKVFCELVPLVLKGNKPRIRLKDVPWPSGPKENPFSFPPGLGKKIRVKLVRRLQLKWHPDKFQQRFGNVLCDSDAATIVDRVLELSKILNSLKDA